jgi:hypothetical protein
MTITNNWTEEGVVPLGSAQITTIERTKEIVGAGCIAYHLSVFDKIPQPWYAYKYDETHSSLLNTEDAYCHEQLLAAGIPFFVLGAHWATHAKTHELDRPRIIRF